jgi:hypothetical protein
VQLIPIRAGLEDWRAGQGEEVKCLAQNVKV